MGIEDNIEDILEPVKGGNSTSETREVNNNSNNVTVISNGVNNDGEIPYMPVSSLLPQQQGNNGNDLNNNNNNNGNGNGTGNGSENVFYPQLSHSPVNNSMLATSPLPPSSFPPMVIQTSSPTPYNTMVASPQQQLHHQQQQQQLQQHLQQQQQPSQIIDSLPPPYMGQQTHAFYQPPPPNKIQSPYHNVNIVYQTSPQPSVLPPIHIPIDSELWPPYTPDTYINQYPSYGLGSTPNDDCKILKEKCNSLCNVYVQPNQNQRVDDSLVQSLGDCKSLEFLNLSNCTNFSVNVFTKTISRLSNLKCINLNNCSHLNDAAIKHLAKSCQHLEEIHLNNCYLLTDDSVMMLAERCKSVKTLSLSRCERVTDKSIQLIAKKLPKLESLCINRLKYITDAGLSELRVIPGMKSLYAYDTLVSDQSISELVLKWKQLEVINLAKCQKVTDVSISTLALHCSSIQKLFLQHCQKITSQSIILVSQKCPLIRVLRIDGCINVTDEAILALESLKNLQVLNLSQLSKINEHSIVQILPHLTHLDSLFLYSCPRVSDITVGRVALCYPNLKTLRIDQSIFPGDQSIQSVARHCRSLKMLNLSYLDYVHDETVIVVAKELPYLQKLYLTGCKNLTDLSLNAITSAQSLEVLRLDAGFQFSESSLMLLSKLINLTILNISGCSNVSDQVLDLIICYCRQMAQLYMSNLPLITDKVIPPMLASLCSLKILRIDGCPNITDRSLNGLKFLQPLYLEVFNCSGTSIGDEGLLAIASQSTLRELYLWGCDQITDKGINSIQSYVENLEVLRLDRCTKLTDKGIRSTIQKCQLLRTLNISGTMLSDATLLTVSTNCKLLKKLIVQNCQKVTDTGLMAVFVQCPLIKMLDVAKVQKVTDLSVIDLSNRCKFLKKVNFNGCSKISSSSIIKLSVGCPLLTRVNLHDCVLVEEVAVLALSTYCKQIAYLNVTNCTKVTDLAIVGIGRECLGLKHLYANNCPLVGDSAVIELAVRSNINLETLEIQNCLNVTDNSMNMISQLCPSLKTLNILNTKATFNAISQIKLQCRLLKDFKFNN